MRIAVTTGLLPIPPTYFVVQHALQLRERHTFGVFARAADIRDPDLGIAIDSAVPAGIGSWRLRSYLALGAGRTHARHIRAFTPDLVHQHFATWMFGAISAGAPVITTLHGYDVAVAEARDTVPLALFHRRNVGRAIESTRQFLAVSRDLADRAIAAGFPAERVEVHYQGIDVEFFTPPSAPEEPAEADRDGRPILVFVGALARRKGLPDLLRASERLSTTVPHRLRVIGVGPLEAELGAAAEQNEHIEVYGSRSREEIREVLRGARALVLPTQRDGQWREAAGLVLLEAQACGTPAIAYASGGTPEMIRDGETGLLVPERNEEALEDALRSILTLSPTEHERMSVQARAWVVANRSLSGSARELDRIYTAVAG